MRRPESITKKYLQENCLPKKGIRISGTNIVSNPTLRKYSFWIYHYDMPYESAVEVFWKQEHKLSIKKYFELRKYLVENGIPFAFLYRSQFRLGTSLWNYDKLRRAFPDIEFAVPYEEDEACEEMGWHK